jgi:hypothetical protein
VAATSSECVAVLIDQAFRETETVESDMVLEHIETAAPVQVNFAINGMDRVARELRAAPLRNKRQSCWSGRRCNNLFEMNSRARLQHCRFPRDGRSLIFRREAKNRMRRVHELDHGICA